MLKRQRAYSRGPRWTNEEVDSLIKYLKNNKLDIKKLQQMFPDRTKTAIRCKVRKIRIKHDLFGNSYREQKVAFTEKVAKQVKIKQVFEAYAGAGHQTFKWIEYADKVFASEKTKSKITQFRTKAKENGFEEEEIAVNDMFLFKKANKSIYYYTKDAIEVAAILRANNIKIDLFDLDTCGSTLPTLPTYFVLLKPKYFTITHGEFHSYRFSREDVLRRLLAHKNINQSPFPMDTDDLANELDIAVKIYALRSHNETKDSFWLTLKEETWLGHKHQGMLRRFYLVSKPPATADCLNILSNRINNL